MDSNLERVIIILLQNLNSFLFDISKRGFDKIEKVINQDNIFLVNYWILLIAILIMTPFLFMKCFRLLDSNHSQIKGYLKENKNFICKFFFIVGIIIYSQSILQFTFQFWDGLINESEILEEVRHSIENGKDTTFSIVMVSSYTALTVLFIMLSQLLEVICLFLVISLSPFIFIGGIFKRELFSNFLTHLIKGIINPVFQTITMYMCFRMILPSIEIYLSLFTKVVIIISMILFSFRFAKDSTEYLFIQKNTPLKEVKPKTIGRERKGLSYYR